MDGGRRSKRGSEERRSRRKEKGHQDPDSNRLFSEFDSMKPEREIIRIDITGINPEVRDTMVPLLELTETKLWKWKTFPIILPEPLTLQPESEESEEEPSGSEQSEPQEDEGNSNSRRKTINIRDLFIEPNFHELDAVSTDSKGEPKKLNQSQLESVRMTGEFEVESVQFAGQKHTWRLSQLLQKGSARSTQTLRRDLAKALTLIVVTAKEYLIGDIFSVKKSWKGWRRWIKALIDILIGLSSLHTSNLEERLAEERAKYLVCELVPQLPGSIDQLAAFVRRLVQRSSIEKGQVIEEKVPMINFIYQTPQDKEIDLRLSSSEVMNKAKPLLARIVDRESQGWFPQFREDVLTELQTKLHDNSTLQLEANKRVSAEYLRRVSAAILRDEEISSIGPGIPRLLVDQLRAGILFQEALQTAELNLERHLHEQEEKLKRDHTILCEIKDWMADRLNERKVEYLKDEEWEPHLLALRYCREGSLDQHAYFLSRDHSFLLTQEPVLQKELLQNLCTPTRTFTFRTQIWRPQRWKVTENYKGCSEVIPTVVHKHTGKTSYRQNSNSDDPVYLVEKEAVMTNSTKKPFWRWANFMYRTWSWFWNFSFMFLVVIPWCSPFSIRSLLYLDPFYPDFEVSQLDGSLHKKASSATETLHSRVRNLWRHISKCRSDFEASPDRSFLGKTLLRHFNRFVNYVLKGFLGSLILIFIFPVLCVLISGLSLTLAVLGPVLVPSFSLVLHILGAVLFDFETNSLVGALVPNFIWNFLILGVVQPVIGLLVSLVVCPLVALGIAGIALSRKALRQIWDTVMYHLLIRKRARVPLSDSFIARRISGPGMASTYFYQIKTEQALIALEARMEEEELLAFQDEMSDIITSPLEDYRKFVANTFRPLGVSVNKQQPGPYKDLEEETNNLLNSLQTKVSTRQNQLRLSLPESTRMRIKLTERELKLALGRGAAMAQGFYPSHVIRRSKGGSTKFWDSRGLRTEDWIGLVSSLYAEIFSEDFLTPIQEADTIFHLKVENWNLTRYLNMVLESDWHDDLDVARAVHTPMGNINIQTPYIDTALFNPLAQSGTIFPTVSLEKWKLNDSDLSLLPRLSVPLPIPHPAIVSIIIYNRDSDNPIKIEDCKNVLRDLRQYPQPMSMEYLVGLKEEEEGEDEEQDRSINSQESRDSMHEMGPELDSLTHSLEQLDTQDTQK